MHWENDPEWTKLKIPISNNKMVEIYWPAVAVIIFAVIVFGVLPYYIFGLLIGAILKFLFNKKK